MKIIKIIKVMHSKSSITFDESQSWTTTKGLIQGSWLSPVLFNFYINPLLQELEKENTWFRAYADNIVLAVELKEINTKLVKIIKWWEQYKVMLNSQKSGILGILNRAGKTKEIKNCANIPEVKEYKYFEITINQSLNFNEIIKKLK